MSYGRYILRVQKTDGFNAIVEEQTQVLGPEIATEFEARIAMGNVATRVSTWTQLVLLHDTGAKWPSGHSRLKFIASTFGRMKVTR
jgi:hypothetical protein